MYHYSKNFFNYLRIIEQLQNTLKNHKVLIHQRSADQNTDAASADTEQPSELIIKKDEELKVGFSNVAEGTPLSVIRDKLKLVLHIYIFLYFFSTRTVFRCICYLWYDKPLSDPLNLHQELREELQRLKDQTTPNHQVGDLEFIAKMLGLPKKNVHNDLDTY